VTTDQLPSREAGIRYRPDSRFWAGARGGGTASIDSAAPADRCRGPTL